MSDLFGGDFGWADQATTQVSPAVSPDRATLGATVETAETCRVEIPSEASVATVASVAPWKDGVERLSRGRRPENIDARSWNVLVSDARMLVQTWGADFAEHGWSTLDIFGVPPRPGGRRLDYIGLISLLHGRAVEAVDAETATIRADRNNTSRFYRRLRAAGGVAVWEWV